MNKILSLFACLLVAVAVHAQDVIVLTDGSTILAKVQKVTNNEVEYKKHSNPTGPTYTIAISEITAINYENGEKDTFSSPAPAAPVQSPATTHQTNTANQPYKTNETASQFSNDRDLVRMYDWQNYQKYEKRVKKAKIITVTSGVVFLAGIIFDIKAMGDPQFDCYGNGTIGVALTLVGLAGTIGGGFMWHNNAKKIKEMREMNISQLTFSEFSFESSNLQLGATLMNTAALSTPALGIGLRYNF